MSAGSEPIHTHVVTPTSGSPVKRRHTERRTGESNTDALDRLAGERRAAEIDRDVARAERDAALAALRGLVDNYAAEDSRAFEAAHRAALAVLDGPAPAPPGLGLDLTPPMVITLGQAHHAGRLPAPLYPYGQWRLIVSGLRRRGLIDEDGALTATGLHAAAEIHAGQYR